MTILGLHHIMLGCSNAQQTVDFYTGVLGLRFVKKTVNFDAPDTYHLYFGDATGSPGSAVTFFEWPTAPKGRPGPGWTVDEDPDALGSTYREPPADMIVRNRDEAAIAAATWPEPVPNITPDMALMHGMHHITTIGTDIMRTHAFYGELLGMRRVKMTSNFDDPDSAHWYWGVGDGQPGTLITCFKRDPAREPRVRIGVG